MKKLILINPVGRRSGTLLSRFSTFPPLSCAYVAAMTPSNWEVKIIDENFQTFSYEEADLVGITAFTSNITRAYDLADIYRRRRIKVVMGGIHVSMLPNEALHHADSVVIGEVEGIWPRVIADFENNRLSPTYTGPRVDFAQYSVKPRRDLLDPNYLWNSVQTSRGCPFDCNFCSVSKYLGKRYRQRDPDDVLDELEEIQGDFVFFLDDNLVGYTKESRHRSTKLFQGMIDRGLSKRWWMQSSINLADDEEVVRLAAEAGCMYVFIGFESTSPEKLTRMRKSINLKIGVDNYRRVVETFHRHGIAVLGAFVIGNDHESPRYYRDLARHLTRSGIDIVQITLLTPLPGTDLMNQLQDEGRLIFQDFPRDWDKYRFSYMVHQPEGLDIDTIYTGNNFLKHRIYTFPVYHYRLAKSFLALKNPTNFYAAYKANKAYKKGWLNSHYHAHYPVRFTSQAD